MKQIYQRSTKSFTKPIEYQGELLRWLYESKLGKFLLPLATSPFISFLATLIDHTPFSKRKIEAFIQLYSINLSDYTQTSFISFADFFTRKYKSEQITICSNEEVIAVAQAKLQLFKINKDSVFTIKNQNYTLKELMQSHEADLFDGGTLCVYRLGMEDYHRYLAAESGYLIDKKLIKGKLHSVREIAQQHYKVFKENKRSYTLINIASDIVVLQMEIGALLVGKINNHKKDDYTKGEEKGFFSLGGSTIVVAYPAGTVKFDDDLIEFSKQNIETQVQIGERIGIKLCSND